MDRRAFIKNVARAGAVAGASLWTPAAAVSAAGTAAGGVSPGTAEAAGGSPPEGAADGLTLVGAGDCIITRRVSELTDPDFRAV
ncbi:MAG TPA: hypothetical protein VMW75_06230, partial [Thermoanaerobaculia bacterium]|nr:hypothetical protein [Thermoanaerobaculia bacterium]